MGGTFFSVTSHDDDTMSLDFDTEKQSGFREGICVCACVSFVWLASAHALATQLSHTPPFHSPSRSARW